MGWVDSLKGSIVGLDTAPLVYFTEKHPVYLKVVYPFFQAIQRREIAVVTSTITLLETLVYPIRHNDIERAQKYQLFLFRTKGVNTTELSQQIAEEAARLRAFHRVQIADAIQMATAIHMNATYFLTNDLRLPSLPGLKVLTLDEIRTRPEYLEPEDVQ